MCQILSLEPWQTIYFVGGFGEYVDIPNLHMYVKAHNDVLPSEHYIGYIPLSMYHKASPLANVPARLLVTEQS
jgi:hypothetical protein